VDSQIEEFRKEERRQGDAENTYKSLLGTIFKNQRLRIESEINADAQPRLEAEATQERRL
jgi:hypothetical protein